MRSPKGLTQTRPYALCSAPILTCSSLDGDVLAYIALARKSSSIHSYSASFYSTINSLSCFYIIQDNPILIHGAPGIPFRLSLSAFEGRVDCATVRHLQNTSDTEAGCLEFASKSESVYAVGHGISDGRVETEVRGFEISLGEHNPINNVLAQLELSLLPYLQADF